MSRRTVAWLCATEVIHVCKACSSAVGFHQGGESGRIVSDVVSVVVSIPFVSRIVVFLLAKSLASSQEQLVPVTRYQQPLRPLGKSRYTAVQLSTLWEQ